MVFAGFGPDLAQFLWWILVDADWLMGAILQHVKFEVKGKSHAIYEAQVGIRSASS